MADDWLDGIRDGMINPEPIVLEESELIVSEFLSPAKLRDISGEQDLKLVEAIEMIVNTTETTLGNFGQYLPSLMQLKLSDSIIPSVRDIGTSFKCLTILWMSRCGLNDVDGIASMQSLQELYIAYNNIDDISPISFLDALEVLDLEANKISDIGQIDYLSIMTCLTTLTLSGNAITRNFSNKVGQMFREFVLEKVPHLQQLDDEASSDTGENNVAISASASSHSQEDIDLITKAIKEGIDIVSDTDSIDFSSTSSSPRNFLEDGVKSSSLLPSSFSMSPARRFNLNRPATASVVKRPPKQASSDTSSPVSGTRPGSSGSDSGLLYFDDSSPLTIGNPLCGNPMQALKHRKNATLSVMPFRNQETDFISKPVMRPSTSIGLRRPMKVTTEDRRKSLDYGIQTKSVSNINSNTLSSKALENKHGSNNGVATESADDPISYHFIERKIFHPHQSPSPPSRVSPTAPFTTPTPPRSPQRPQSTRDFRSGFFRRPYSSTSQSVNVMAINGTYKATDTLRSQIDD